MIGKWRRRVSLLLAIMIFLSVLPFGYADAASPNSEGRASDPSTGMAIAMSNVAAAVYGNTPLNGSEDEQQVIVTFKDKVDRSLIKGKIKREHSRLPMLVAKMSNKEIEELKKKASVRSVEPDIQLQASALSVDWGRSVVQAAYAWDAGYTGKGIKVAVIDSGINIHHDDLTVAGGASFIGYTTSYDDDNGHGTHAAGIIGAKSNEFGITGVAPDASLYAVKVLDSKGTGYLSDVLAGIEWAVSNKMDIINLSLGTNVDSPALHSAVDMAYSNGLLIVASAGNNGNPEGTGDTIQYPAKYSSVIAVGAVDQNKQRAAFSATGSELEFVAPGVGIYSTYLNNGYSTLSGTSTAAPYVTGVLALMKQKMGTAANVQIRNQLDTYASDLGQLGKDSFYGYGLVQWYGDGKPIYLPPPYMPVTNSVYSSVYGNVYLNASSTGPYVWYKYDLSQYPNPDGVYDDTQYWPSLINALSTSFYSDPEGHTYRCVLYSDNSVKCNYDNGYTVYDDTSYWPSLNNAKAISRYMDANGYDSSCVLYGDNTVKCKSNWSTYDDTMSWPSLINAKSISFTMDSNGVNIQCVLYKDSTIKCNGYDTSWVESPAYWPSLNNAKSIL